MRSVIIKVVVALLVLLGALGVVDHFYKFKNNKLVLRTQFQGLTRDALQARKAEIDLLKAEYDSYKQARGSFSSLELADSTLSQEVVQLETERASLKEQFVQAVLKKRSVSAGVTVPEVQLANGSVLKEVNFKSFGDEEVSLVHAGGIMRIPGTDLPPAINERMRYGKPPMLGRSTAASTVGAMDPNLGSKTDPGKSTPTTPADEKAARKLRIAKLQGQIQELESQISALRENQSTWLRRSRDLRSQAYELRSRGRPVSVINGQIAESDQSAAAFDSKIANLKEEQGSVRRKLSEELAMR